MLDTSFSVRAENHDRFAALYAPLSGGGLSNVNRGAASNEAREPPGWPCKNLQAKVRFCNQPQFILVVVA